MSSTGFGYVAGYKLTHSIKNTLVGFVRFPDDCEFVPTGFDPDQSPDAVQLATCDAVQFKLVDVLYPTLVSSAPITTDGDGGSTKISSVLVIVLFALS